MKRQIIEFVQRVVGTKRILERLDKLETIAGAGTASVPDLQIMPGTPYSRFAIPLEYPPSRSFAPRYGYSHGRIAALEQWFGAHDGEYQQFLEELHGLQLGNIPINLLPNTPLAPAWVGGAICAFDSLALYAMVQKYRPETYLEIGSGMTTCFAKQSICDAGLPTRIISIDPEPRREIDAICDQVIRDGLETCDLAIFDRLKAGDILFFDGSHRSFMNSDVTVFFIDVLPRLKPGVIVHIHDILLPWDYPESFKYWYWSEQYLLAVYLMSSMERLQPLLPTTWICRSPAFETFFQKPFIDLGSPDVNLSWRGGGSMWFTKRTG